MERSAETDTLKHINQATSPHSEPSSINPVMTSSVTGRSTTKNEKRSANTLYQELSFQDNEESEENEVTGKIFYFIKELLFINSFKLCSLVNQILLPAYNLVFFLYITEVILATTKKLEKNNYQIHLMFNRTFHSFTNN